MLSMEKTDDKNEEDDDDNIIRAIHCSVVGQKVNKYLA